VDERERRLTENELLFREVNERIDDVAAELGGGESAYEFLCECSRSDCVERISLTVRQYREIRARARVFVVAEGHEIAEIERVVGRVAPGVAAVEKTGEAGREVEKRTRPRPPER
jgi:uncharacterized protein YicC (UPF0701 family)